MNQYLSKIVLNDIKNRSFRHEILSGKKKLPIKYILAYEGHKDYVKVASAYCDYLFQYEFNKYSKKRSIQMTLEDFIND